MQHNKALFRWVVIAGTLAIGLPQSGHAEPRKPRLIQLADAGTDSTRERSHELREGRSTDRVTPAASTRPGAGAPIWVPRARRGAPASRVGGATRNSSVKVTIQTLVPEIDEAALTLAAQPNLYWYISEPTHHSVNFTLIDSDAIDPLIDVMLEGPFEAGVHRVAVADHDVQLEPGHRYEWFVAVVSDPANRASDTVARGAIERIEDKGLATQLEASTEDAAAALLAQAGIWYDALDSVSQSARRRDAMLEQVGLELDR